MGNGERGLPPGRRVKLTPRLWEIRCTSRKDQRGVFWRVALLLHLIAIISKSAKNQNFDQVSKVPPDVDYNKDEFFFLILIPQKTANICLLLHGSPVSHGSLV